MDKGAHYSKMLDSAHFILADKKLTSLKYMSYVWSLQRARTLYSVDLDMEGLKSYRVEIGDEDDFKFESLLADVSDILIDKIREDPNSVKNKDD